MVDLYNHIHHTSEINSLRVSLVDPESKVVYCEYPAKVITASQEFLAK